MRRLFALLTCLVACTSHAADTPPLSRDIKDWNVTCDNVRTCTAVSTRPASAEAGELYFPLRITRQAGPQGALRVGVFSYIELHGDPLIDGQPVRMPLVQRKRSDYDVSAVPELRSATGASALTFIKALRNAHELAFSTSDDPTTASLDGMTGALLLIDDIQGRVGTVTALARPGAAPASDVPAAPAAPVAPAWTAPAPLDKGVAEQVLKAAMDASRQQWQRDVVDDDEPKGEVHALNAEQALLIVQTGCSAYNCAYRLYVTPLADPAQVKGAPFEEGVVLPDVEPDGSVAFDPATGELTSLTLAMGMGGCGTTARWRYDGARFVLIHAAQMNACMGLSDHDWPVLWETKAQR
ncbi:DUF1176 domain-containing protein [Pseudomonas sp. RP23018S]|uniref:DUF1176 domain-containing protein n=1 Tax=Pseudomonas sp. RP23018S TaxID=3096037 RepID=UPI002ACAD999|nr:DUF1176 domain-containing protein [Pseudomonas sp. RP23018S]MDZ5601831.1 DUF1176 domain-containing protein [Pseudomonas sp. RP23018S]